MQACLCAVCTHPFPFHCRRIELPHFTVPKNPKVASSVGPACRTSICYKAVGDVTCSRDSQRTVYSGRGIKTTDPFIICIGILKIVLARQSVASAHPGPFLRGWIELPKVVEETTIKDIGWRARIIEGIAAHASKKPGITVSVSPGSFVNSGSWKVSGGRCTQRAVDSGLSTTYSSPIVRSWISETFGIWLAPRQPGPFVDGGIEVPKAVTRSLATVTRSSEEPEIAALVGPACSFEEPAWVVINTRHSL